MPKVPPRATLSANGHQLQSKPARIARGARELIFGDLWEFDPAPETADPKLKKR